MRPTEGLLRKLFPAGGRKQASLTPEQETVLKKLRAAVQRFRSVKAAASKAGLKKRSKAKEHLGYWRKRARGAGLDDLLGQPEFSVEDRVSGPHPLVEEMGRLLSEGLRMDGVVPPKNEFDRAVSEIKKAMKAVYGGNAKGPAKGSGVYRDDLLLTLDGVKEKKAWGIPGWTASRTGAWSKTFRRAFTIDGKERDFVVSAMLYGGPTRGGDPKQRDVKVAIRWWAK